MTNFSGFPVAGLQFLTNLQQNNNREWFEANKPTYTEHLLNPALEFIGVFGERLHTLHDDITYDLRTNGSGSLMRIYRDTRFSKDKTPYKTNLGIFFWRGNRKKMENPGYFVHIDAEGARVYAGLYGFSKAQLEAYREAVDDEQRGPALQAAAEAVFDDDYPVMGREYKRVPRGYDAAHPRADLLRHKSLGTH